MAWPQNSALRSALAVAVLAIAMVLAAHRAAAEADGAIFRIEAGNHAAQANAIAFDAASGLVATVANDNTVRLWLAPAAGAGDARSPELTGVIRLPIDSAGRGKALAVALSPGARTLAVGGVAGDEVATENDPQIIWLIDPDSQSVKRRLTAKGKVLRLAFSPDGALLAAGLANGKGLSIWNAESGEKVYDDQDSYRDAKAGVDGLAFSKDGHLATAARDGNVRVYGSPLKSPPRIAYQSNDEPFRVAYAPDGATLAIGHARAPVVAIVRPNSPSAKPVIRALPPVLQGQGPEGLSSVAWSTTGKTIFAGGSYRALQSDVAPVFAWAADQKDAAPRRLAALGNTDTIVDLAASPDERVIALANDATFGAYALDNSVAWKQWGIVQDLRPFLKDRTANLRASPDGLQVELRMPAPGSAALQYAVFDARMRVAKASPLPAKGFVSVGVAASGDTLPVNVVLADRDQVRSVGRSPAGSLTAIGTDRTVQLYDKAGKRLWVQTASAPVWAVVALDNSLIVSAQGDGAIVWREARAGHVILTLFMHPDGRRWILWAPDGRFDASIGGDGLAGWHVNAGGGELADFYAARDFKARYRDAGLAQSVLTAVKDPTPVSAPVPKGSQWPTAFRILRDETLADGSRRISFLLTGEPPGPDAQLRVYANDVQRTELRPALALKTGAPNYVLIPRQLAGARIDLKIDRKDGQAASSRGLVPVDRASGVAQVKLRRLFAVVVGVSSYRNQDLNLDYSAKDAEDIESALKAQEGKLYENVFVRTLTDKKATKQDVLAALNWLGDVSSASDVQSGDRALLFMAAHGIRTAQKQYVFVPHDWPTMSSDDPAYGVTERDVFQRFLSRSRVRNLIFLDTCHSAAFWRRKNDINAFANDLRNNWSAQVWTASEGDQVALEGLGHTNGLFTLALLEAMDQRKPIRIFSHPSRIIEAELSLWLQNRVNELSSGAQTSTQATSGGIEVVFERVVRD